ncbi:serine hydrolase [Paenibacillus sp. 598K]|uniref:serine hydrolase n=1 Tax=Paenibacillus sp. 598K TaxID=1117987 RepID=UPI000FFF603F|nr:serine hydrolase [Paenibacillus sp. 598K]
MYRGKSLIRKRMVAALLVLSLAGAEGAYAQGLLVDSMAASSSVVANPSFAADFTSGPRERGEVETFLDAFFGRTDIREMANAIAVSVVRDGEVLVSKGYGTVERHADTPVEGERTGFRIASVSKVFTAAAIMQLVDQGKLNLDDNIEKYLDGYKLTNPFGRPVTIKHLLTHTTGFEVREPTDAGFVFDDAVELASLKEGVFLHFPSVIREPGTTYMYDNFASRLQGYIVEQASGQRFEEYMQQHVFQPLGMLSSSYEVTPEIAGTLAASFDAEGNPIPLYRFSPSSWPEGSMISTATDMARFMTVFLNGGKTADGTVILSPESVKAMATFQTAIHPDLPDTTYGFEAPILPSKTNGEAVISKAGDIAGFSSLLWLLPDRKTGIFLSYSSNEELRDEFFTAFMDHYFKGGRTLFGPADYEPQPEEALVRLEGLYSDLRMKLLTRVKVAGDGELVVTDYQGDHILTQLDDLLFVDDEGKILAFKEEEDGLVTALKYSNFVSYAMKAQEDRVGLPDVPLEHPYAESILGLRSFGYLEADSAELYRPGQTVTRGEFIHALNAIWNITSATNQLLFTDIEQSPYRSDIQAAAEAGLLNGTGADKFEPDRPIRREEAAVIMYRLLTASGVQAPDADVVLVPGTSDWAVDAVSSAIHWKLYGPEVVERVGQIDFASQRALNKQEMAVILFKSLGPDHIQLQGS